MPDRRTSVTTDGRRKPRAPGGWSPTPTPGQIPFEHVLPAHGTPVLGGARDRYAARFHELFGI